MKLASYTPAIVAAAFALLFVLEKWFPLREARAGLWARLVVNLSLSAIALLVAARGVFPSAPGSLAWASAQSSGLIHLLPGPGWMRFAVGFLLLDLTFYDWHGTGTTSGL